MNKPRQQHNIQAAPADCVQVTVIRNGTERQLMWHTQTPLLNALLNAGIEAPHSCCRGNCGTCVCRLEEGEVRLRRNYILSEAHTRQGLILTCVAAPVSDHIRISYDEF